MARPKNKEELIQLSQKNFKRLHDLIDSYTSEQQIMEFPKGTLNRNIRDVLSHLHHWHLLILEWYEIGMSGQKPAMPAEGYTWKTTPELNKWIWKKYQSIDLGEAKKMLNQSNKKVQRLIEQHTDEDLFEKKKYKWTGSTSLGAYLISATSSHYDWAWKLIKSSCKQVGNH